LGDLLAYSQGQGSAFMTALQNTWQQFRVNRAAIGVQAGLKNDNRNQLPPTVP
jgi:hypothetical protein